MLKQFLRKTFDLREGEMYISLLMQLYIFLIITALLIIKPTINALFLSRLGADHLPYGYLAMAILAIIVSFTYNKILRKFSLRPTLTVTLVSFSLLFVTLSALLYLSYVSDWILFLYYLIVSLFAVLTTSQFWVFANLVYNAREAKRLFGFIGAGGIAGGIFGGYLTSGLAPIIGNKGLIVIASGLIFLCIPIIQSVWSLRVKKLTSYTRRQIREGKGNPSTRSSFKIIIRSKHLAYLASIVGVSVIMAKLVDFQFSDFAQKAIKNPDELASFFGFWFSSFNVIALILQLFITNRVLNQLGVTSTLLILPLSIAIGCLLFLTIPELWVLIMIKGLDGSFKQSINKAATELSILPIHFSIKNQAKSYIDIVVDSVATGISGFVLIFIIKRLELSTSYITIIILLLLFFWIVLIYQLREAYFNSFRDNLQKSIHLQDSHKKILSKETTLASATRILKSGSDEDILSLLERLGTYKMKSLREPIIALLDHQNIKIKTEAVKQLFGYDQGHAQDKIKQFISAEDETLVFHSMEYLMYHTDIKNSDNFVTYLNHEKDSISFAALLCLAKESVSNRKLRIKYALDERIANKVTELVHTPGNGFHKAKIAKLLTAIAYTGLQKYYAIITPYLINHDDFLTKEAIKAAGITRDERFIDNLLELLAFRTFRKTTVQALKNYGPGIISTITKLDRNENINDQSRKYVAKVIEAFHTQEAVSSLLRLLRSKDIVVRLQASKSLLKIKQQDTEKNLLFNQKRIFRYIALECKYYKNTIRAIHILERSENVSNVGETTLSDRITELIIAKEGLIDLLTIQLGQSLECLFKLLGLRYDQTDIHSVYSGLISTEKEAKLHALEFLDNLIHLRLKKKIIPALEYYSAHSSSVNISLLNLKPITEEKCLKLLIRNRGKKMKLAVINLIQNLNISKYTGTLRTLSQHKNAEVASMAKDTLNRAAIGT